MKRANPEQRLQIAVAAYLRLALRSPTTWTAIGHGGGGKVRGALLKASGVVPGWPDLLIMHPMFANTLVVGIELKAKKGRVSPQQRGISMEFALCNAGYHFARSLEDVEYILRTAGIPLFASTGGPR